MSDAIVFLGTSFRRVGFERLGGYVIAPEESSALLALGAALSARELAVVATCNRVEVYAALPDAAPALDALSERVAAFFRARGHGAAQAGDFLALEGDAAVEHLFAVAASLESLVLGECEIAGQVRRAADAAEACGLLGPALRPLFERALRTARRVRAETAIGRTPVSVASLVLKRAREHFRGREARAAALVGVGDMTRKVGQMLCGKGTRLLFVNRTLSRAEELASRYGGRALALETFRDAPPADLDLVVTATRAPSPVVTPQTLAPALAAPRAEPLLCCDLGVPHDVAGEVDGLKGVRVLRLPDLEHTARENQERLAGEAERVREIVREEARRSSQERRARALAAESADALLAARLAHLAPEDRQAVRRFALGLAERLARQPR